LLKSDRWIAAATYCGLSSLGRRQPGVQNQCLFGFDSRSGDQPTIILTVMSVLDRYLNTEKYQGIMRDFCNAQILNDKTKCGLFLKENVLSRIGWNADVSEFPDGEEYEHTYNNGDSNKGLFFKTPRMVILHCGFRKDTTFIENSDKAGIEGIYPRDSFLYDDWEEKNPGKPSPYKRRRLILMFLVNKDGVAVHKKPLILSLHGGASNMFCDAYGTFVEQLESALQKLPGRKAALVLTPSNQRLPSLPQHLALNFMALRLRAGFPIPSSGLFLQQKPSKISSLR
jgi:hypothetical protein